MSRFFVLENSVQVDVLQRSGDVALYILNGPGSRQPKRFRIGQHRGTSKLFFFPFLSLLPPLLSGKDRHDAYVGEGPALLSSQLREARDDNIRHLLLGLSLGKRNVRLGLGGTGDDGMSERTNTSQSY